MLIEDVLTEFKRTHLEHIEDIKGPEDWARNLLISNF